MTSDRNREISTLLGLLRSPNLDEGLKANMIAQLIAWGKSKRWIENHIEPTPAPKKKKSKYDEVEVNESEVHDMDRILG